VTRGTDEAFEGWVIQHRARLHRAAFLLCGSWSVGDDLVQEALIRCYPRWDRITRHGDDPYAYVRKTVVRLAVDHRRRLTSRREFPVAVVPDAAQREGPELGEVWDALRGMPAGQRAVVVLRYWEGLSVAETATCVGKSEGNVKSQASRGLEALRKALTSTSETKEML